MQWITALMSFHIQVSVSEREIPGSVIAGLKGVCICHLGRYYHLFCLRVCTSFLLHHQNKRVPVSPEPHQPGELSDLLISANLMG